MLLQLDGLGVRFGGLDALGDVSFALEPGVICGLIGPNGSGKTTLVNSVTGIVTPTAGDIRFEGGSLRGLSPNAIAAAGIRRTFQNLEIFRRLTVLDNVLVGAHLGARGGIVTSGLRWPGARRDEVRVADEARRLLELVGLGDVATARAGDLSFGDQRLVEVARALAGRPRLLLLDEPAAGLSRPRIHDLKMLLERLRRELGLTILLVEHVMALVMDVCDRVLVLDSGRTIFDGTPRGVQADERVRSVYLGQSGDVAGMRAVLAKRLASGSAQKRRRDVIDTDVLVIGGGAAALRAALESADHGARTLLVSKGPITKSGNTPMAGGGVQAVLGPDDSVELHLEDTAREAHGLGSSALARRLVEDAAARVRDLEAYGVQFQRMSDGALRVFQMPGLARARNVYVRGGGWGLMAALDREVRKRERITVHEDVMLARLTRDEGGVTGAVFVDLLSGRVRAVRAGAVVLATGGYEALWSFTDASLDATGEGTVIASDAGADLLDPEMVLFYPSVVCHPQALRGMAFYYEFVLSQELGAGRLVNGRGEEFLGGQPVRDRLCRAIVEEVAQGRGTRHGGVFADLRTSSRSREELGRLLQQWMPGEFKRLQRLGIDPRDTPVEVYPGVHYCLGGLAVDPDAATSVSRLFAAGEVAGNVHGANRLAGNALTETQVFGARAGVGAARVALGGARGRARLDAEVVDVEQLVAHLTASRPHAPRAAALKRRLQDLMWAHVGPVRDARGLSEALQLVDGLAAEVAEPAFTPVAGYSYELQEALELRGMLPLARAVITGALARTESRGHHYRADFPPTGAAAQGRAGDSPGPALTVVAAPGE